MAITTALRRTAVWVCILCLAGHVRGDIPAAPSIELTDISFPCHVAVGDLNNDGAADLVVSSWFPEEDGSYDGSKSRVYIYYQANGTFAAPADKQVVIANPWGVSIGDFDADGSNDLAVATKRDDFYLMLGKEKLDVLHHSKDARHRSYFVQADRLNDRAVHDFVSGATWRKWNGGDQFDVGYFYGPEGNNNKKATLADLNGDDATDVIFTTTDNEVRLYYGPLMNKKVVPTDLSQFVQLATPAPPRNLAVGDINSDGRPDLIVTIRQGEKRQTLIYYQQSPTGFAPDAAPNVVIEDVSGMPHITDLNQDGLDDLVVGDGDEHVYCFLQKKDAPFPASAENAAQVLRIDNYSLAIGDINGDSKPDIVAGSVEGNVVRIYLNGEKPKSPKSSTAGPLTDSSAGLDRFQPSIDPFVVPFYTGTIQPVPQKVEYTDRYLSLESTGIILGQDIAPDDARFRVLTERIQRYGGTSRIVDSVSDACDTFIVLGDTDLDRPTPPDRPQGYVMHCTERDGKNLVFMRSSDHQGLLWAITSFNQLVHHRDGKIVARAAEVFDYPAILNRGYIGGHWGVVGPLGGAWCTARFKMNKFVFSSVLGPKSPWKQDWRLEKPEFIKQQVREIGEYLTPLGLEWYVGDRTLSYPDPQQQIRCASDEDFQIVLGLADLAARHGGGFALKFDDIRYPLHPEDESRFGSAREADVFFVNRLYAAMQKNHPGSKLLFCPVFYWGPTSNHSYPESRDDYLFALGNQLPKEIDIWWTGPGVKSNVITPAHVQWITERIKRKPVFWQNSFGMPHVYGYSYTTDPVEAWPKWHYDGFFKDVDTYMLNGGNSSYATALVTLADFLWNPDAYDAERSIREATRKLAGPDNDDNLIEVTRLLSYFDKFGLRVSPAAARRVDDMERTLAELETAVEKTAVNYPAALDAWTGTRLHHLYNMRRYVKRLQANPDLAAYAADATVSRQRAAKEAKLSDATDTFLSAYDFLGGVGPTHYGHMCEKRLATYIYGEQSANPEMASGFTVEPFPPSADYQLIISAQDDETDNKCRIRITVNDKTIFEGPNPFVSRGWSRHTFRIPADVLSRKNKLVIHSGEDTNHIGRPPWFMLNYAVVRRVDSQAAQ